MLNNIVIYIFGGNMSKFISDKAKLGKSIILAKNIIIEDNVTIGNNCMLGYNIVIRKGTTIGDNVRIDDNTVIGKYPMRANLSIFKEEKNLLPTKHCQQLFNWSKYCYLYWRELPIC